eukprot:gene2459-2832_t
MEDRQENEADQSTLNQSTFEDCSTTLQESNGNISMQHITSISSSPMHKITLEGAETVTYLQHTQNEVAGKAVDKRLSKKVRKYYCDQSKLISSFLGDKPGDIQKLQKPVARAAQVSFFANLVLIVAKAIAVGLSGSLVVISSLVDSAVDLLSGVIILYTSKAMKQIDIYNYPIGRSRLEPVAIVILSCIMATASVVIIRESIEGIINKRLSADMSPVSLALVGSTILIKFVLYIYCRRYDSPSIVALSVDHFNDTVSNSAALIFGALGSYVWLYADPIGAILISIYIFYNWWKTGAQQIKNLTGKTAPAHILQRITWIAVTHDDRIEKIESVMAFRTGNRYLAEVDIVLPENMTLRKAHNIGETLQQKIEKLNEVERAFVHVDYEFCHVSTDEHKYVTT